MKSNCFIAAHIDENGEPCASASLRFPVEQAGNFYHLYNLHTGEPSGDVIEFREDRTSPNGQAYKLAVCPSTGNQYAVLPYGLISNA